jgi:Ni,Fe-hydrogenase III small subunit/ferredoxin
MPWVFRGLREGIVTTRYPRQPDDYGPSFRASVSVLDPVVAREDGKLAALCPTGAISVDGGAVSLDGGRCILCGRCVTARPDRFAFSSSPEVASIGRAALVVPNRDDVDENLARLRSDLAGRVRSLRRSIHIRHVDAGSDGSEEWEVAALFNPVYDVQRLGIFLTASPRHADVLLVTGAGSIGMLGPLRTTFEAMPDPKVVIAAGTDAASGGIVHPSYATSGGIGAVVPVDVFVPGSPPSPFSLLHGILLALGRLPEASGR